jgi:hypothetical protein
LGGDDRRAKGKRLRLGQDKYANAARQLPRRSQNPITSAGKSFLNPGATSYSALQSPVKKLFCRNYFYDFCVLHSNDKVESKTTGKASAQRSRGKKSSFAPPTFDGIEILESCAHTRVADRRVLHPKKMFRSRLI